MAVKRYENGAWVDASAIRRFENGAWKDVGFGRRYENGAWVDIYPTYNIGIITFSNNIYKDEVPIEISDNSLTTPNLGLYPHTGLVIYMDMDLNKPANGITEKIMAIGDKHSWVHYIFTFKDSNDNVLYSLSEYGGIGDDNPKDTAITDYLPFTLPAGTSKIELELRPKNPTWTYHLGFTVSGIKLTKGY